MILQAEQRQAHRSAVLHPSAECLKGASSLFAVSTLVDTEDEEGSEVFPCLRATSVEGLLEDLELLGGVESAQEGMAEDFHAFLQCCTELHEWEAAQDGCALISTAVAEGIALDAVESNLALAATNRDCYVDKEVDYQRRDGIQRTIEASGLGYAPETLFWGYEDDREEMELLRQTQLVALADRYQRREAVVVGEDWTGDAKQRATTVDLEQRLSVARHIQLFDHDEWTRGDDDEEPALSISYAQPHKGCRKTLGINGSGRHSVHFEDPSAGSRTPSHDASVPTTVAYFTPLLPLGSGRLDLMMGAPSEAIGGVKQKNEQQKKKTRRGAKALRRYHSRFKTNGPG
jgi:hypothetical protein